MKQEVIAPRERPELDKTSGPVVYTPKQISTYESVVASMERILGQDSVLEVANTLPVGLQDALQRLHLAKVGLNEKGEAAAGASRKQLMNQALAILQPVLSLAQAEELQVNLEGYQRVQEGAVQLRHEIVQRIGVEAHPGRPLGPIQPSGRLSEQQLADIGALAWQLARSLKPSKKGKKKVEPTDDDNPIVGVLMSMHRVAEYLAELASTISKLHNQYDKASDQVRKEQLRKKLMAALEELAGAVSGFVQTCLASSESDHPGAYATLRERFSSVSSEYAAVSAANAVQAASAVGAVLQSCFDDEDAILAAEHSGG